MKFRSWIRSVGVVAAALLLMGNVCNRGEDEPDASPTPAPLLESVGSFELVGGLAEVSFGGLRLDLPPEFPESTPEGVNAPRSGSAEVEIADLSERLSSECDLEPEDSVRLHWTSETGFGSPDLPETFEDETEFREAVEGHIIAVLGTIFRERASALADIPGLLPDTLADECTLVAEQIFLVEEHAPLPTSRPAPAVAPTPTPDPAPTREPAPTPTRTPRPSPGPTPVPSPSPPLNGDNDEEDENDQDENGEDDENEDDDGNDDGEGGNEDPGSENT